MFASLSSLVVNVFISQYFTFPNEIITGLELFYGLQQLMEVAS